VRANDGKGALLLNEIEVEGEGGRLA
jgi:hypothetical protein